MGEEQPKAVEPGTAAAAAAAAATDVSNDEPTKSNDASESKDEVSSAPQMTEGATETKDAAVEAAAPAAGETEKKEAGGEVSQKRRREDDDRRGRGPAKKFRKGTMFDPTIQDITDDPLAIRKQVEFYFSDANLARDKFLFDKLEGSKNTPIDIQVIHSFKRMRRYQPYEAVVKALKESDTLEVTEDEKLRRKQPLSADFENKTLEEITKAHDDESMVRSVYVKGFGYEKPSTQFDIEAWFANYGTTNQVRLRRLNDKTFKGSVFAEFDSEEAAKKFIALDPPPKYNDRELKIMSKKSYCEEKAQLVKDGVLKPNNNGGYDHADRVQKSGGNERDWRERREEDRKSGFRSGGRGSHKGFRGRGGRGRGDRSERGHHRSDRDEDAADANGNAGSKDASEQGEAFSEKPTQEESKAEVEA